MCLRVLNNLNNDYPVTGRNMNWFRPIEANLFQFPKGLHKQGLSLAKASKLQLDPSMIFNWQSKFASVVTMMGDEEQGFATVDGMNAEGLVVNVLYDTPATYGKPNYQDKHSNISILRWPQYILDCFKNVTQVIKYAESNSLQLIREKIPEGAGARELRQDKIHLAVSDAAGRSVVIEIKKGKLSVYAGKENQIVTNEPDYPTQLAILTYWQYLWGKTKPAIATPIFTAPGGTSPTQSFERAAFYLTLSQAVENHDDVIAQTRAFMANGAIPFAFNPSQKQYATCTRWTNLAVHKAGQYSFINPLNMMPVWLRVSADIANCAKVKLISVNTELQIVDNHRELQGDMLSYLQPCKEPYKS
ncbi:linear amide C-N hydrolase [Shewanella fidelis]|uniref:linear amide C-N hydrolase n=1 Tax=Shewanella fidelis TaxID=173509 RepID=UPI00048D2C30|nr:linear amide C-N hydrolase [Shewanella fidelis]